MTDLPECKSEERKKKELCNLLKKNIIFYSAITRQLKYNTFFLLTIKTKKCREKYFSLHFLMSYRVDKFCYKTKGIRVLTG